MGKCICGKWKRKWFDPGENARNNWTFCAASSAFRDHIFAQFICAIMPTKTQWQWHVRFRIFSLFFFYILRKVLYLNCPHGVARICLVRQTNSISLILVQLFGKSIELFAANGYWIASWNGVLVFKGQITWLKLKFDLQTVLSLNLELIVFFS